MDKIKFNTDYIKANTYMADQCGVKTYNRTFNDGSKEIWYNPINYNAIATDEWTITDPRCREIIRERFKLMTYFDVEWRCHYDPHNKGQGFYGSGKTIAEAETACILAIVEASHG